MRRIEEKHILSNTATHKCKCNSNLDTLSFEWNKLNGTESAKIFNEFIKTWSENSF